MTTPATDAPLANLMAAALENDLPTYLLHLRELMETVGVVHLVTQLCTLVNMFGREVHGDDWPAVVSTAIHFLDIATTEQPGEGR